MGAQNASMGSAQIFFIHSLFGSISLNWGQMSSILSESLEYFYIFYVFFYTLQLYLSYH